jgi:hypothetical protein
MSLRNCFVLAIALASLAFLIACGSGSSNPVAPPGGGFSKSNLSGTYVFSATGFYGDAVNGTYFTMAGTLSADGNGALNGGTFDIQDSFYGVLTGVTVQNGSTYSITADGRGTGTIVTNLNGSTYPGLSSIGIDFVLTSSSHGMIIRFDNGGTGSGTLDLQSSSVTQSSLTAYSFSLSGLGQSGSLNSVGTFTLNGGTTISNGLEDFNDNLNSSGLTNLALTGSVTLGSSGAPGTALLTATGAPYGQLQFDVWPVDATHFKLIETDGAELLAGDAYTQATTVSSGQLVYALAGFDDGNPSVGMLSSGGYFSYDGSNIVSAGLEDMNDTGTVSQSQTVSGSLITAGGARYVLTVTGFYNGVNGSVSTYVFTGYPFTSGGTTGILLMETDGSGVTAGTAFVQSAQTVASSQGYGLILTGYDANGEVDDIAEFTANSGGTLSAGFMDENIEGSPGFKESLGNGGTYTYDSPATGRGVIAYPATNTSVGTLNLAYYVVNSSTAIFIDGDSAQVGVGAFEQQSASASSNAALGHTQAHFAAVRAAKAARAWRKKN